VKHIYHDGKLCRGVPVAITGRRAQGIKVRFDSFGEAVETWCRRRDKSGRYEAIGWNYWLYKNEKRMLREAGLRG